MSLLSFKGKGCRCCRSRERDVVVVIQGMSFKGKGMTQGHLCLRHGGAVIPFDGWFCLMIVGRDVVGWECRSKGMSFKGMSSFKGILVSRSY